LVSWQRQPRRRRDTLRTLPSAIAADCFNYGPKFKRGIDDVGVLVYRNGEESLRRHGPELRADLECGRR
jgi:hypothetical protein